MMAKFDEVHFENAKGHATNRLSNAELALDNNRLEYARMALNDAHSYLVTMRDEADRDDAPDAVREKYEEIATRYNATRSRYVEAIGEVEEKTEREKIEEAEEVAEMQEAKEHEAALIRFDVECNRIEDQLDDYANELAENHSESDATEKAIFYKLVRLCGERRELLGGDELDARWRRVERLKRRFHDLKRLGVIARRFEKVKEAFFD